MANRKSKNGKANNNGKKRGGNANNTGPQGGPRRVRTLGDASSYLRMLRDPCSAQLVRAPYTGTSSAYLVRTVNTYVPSGPQVPYMDYVYEVTPWNFPNPLISGGAPSGTSFTLSNNVALSNFVTNPNVVRTYRPIAACLRWVPSGPIGARAGVVGMGYSPARTYESGLTVNALQVLGTTMKQDANGSVDHNIVWLPSFGDERFGGNGETNILGAGSMQLVLSGIDTVDNGTGVSNNLAGYIEVTVVWEWEPISSSQMGVVPSAASATRFTLQDVLSRIPDVGSFVLGKAADMAGRLAYQYAAGASSRRGPGMARLQM